MYICSVWLHMQHVKTYPSFCLLPEALRSQVSRIRQSNGCLSTSPGQIFDILASYDFGLGLRSGMYICSVWLHTQHVKTHPSFCPLPEALRSQVSRIRQSNGCLSTSPGQIFDILASYDFGLGLRSGMYICSVWLHARNYTHARIFLSRKCPYPLPYMTKGR